ncbi:MAG: hypothetical protein NZ807_05755, partial [Dehalococcoidia bacterium]|nr:hypothetical protein [Dehalococcoidia bacterium]
EGDCLNGITQLSVEAAKHLALGGPLSLRGIQSLPEDIAATFTEHKEELNLGGLTELSDVAAESLGKHQGHSLILDGLKELSDAAAESLGKHQGSSLNLNGLQELSDAAAKCLGKHHGKSLNLNGLKYLSDAASASLTGHSGKLWLDGLSGLSDAAALSFSRYQGRKLSLNGLTSLSDSAAENLGKREGTSKLSLQGLENLSDAAALAVENKLIQLPSHITKQINLIIKRIATAESLLTREQQSKIRKLIKTNDGDNLAIACELLTVAAASEGDWIKLFPKTRIKELLNSWEPGVWNTLATAFKEFPRLDEMLTMQAADRVYGRLPSRWEVCGRVIDGREVVRMNANDDVIELLKRARRL